MKKPEEVNTLPLFDDILAETSDESKTSVQRSLEVVNQIYTELFAKSDPPLDYNELLNSSDEVKKAFDFNDHYLPMEEYHEIVERHLSNVKLPEYLKRSIKFEVMLGHGPSSARKGGLEEAESGFENKLK